MNEFLDGSLGGDATLNSGGCHVVGWWRYCSYYLNSLDCTKWHWNARSTT